MEYVIIKVIYKLWEQIMLRKFDAITLAEMLITLLIIAVLCLFALSTIKPYDKTFKWLYVRVYHSLETAVYNSMMTRNSKEDDDPLNGFPKDSTSFCNMLKEYMNSAPDDDVPGEVVPKCEAGRDLDINATDFPEEDVQILLTNGVKLWIASDGGKPYVLDEVIDGTPANMKYYIVYADLNGSRGPNAAQWDDTGNINWTTDYKMVDIVAFVVTEASVVVPVGPPEIDTRYMQASVIYPADDENCPDCNRSVPNSYYWAKHDAWGDSKSIAEPMSLNFAGKFPANSPFAITYPEANAVNTAEGCTDENNKISQCFVSIEEYN